jgi:hypothetical protein
MTAACPLGPLAGPAMGVACEGPAMGVAPEGPATGGAPEGPATGVACDGPAMGVARDGPAMGVAREGPATGVAAAAVATGRAATGLATGVPAGGGAMGVGWLLALDPQATAEAMAAAARRESEGDREIMSPRYARGPRVSPSDCARRPGSASGAVASDNRTRLPRTGARTDWSAD